MKTKRTSQYANEHGLPRPDSARFEHGGGGTSNTKGEYMAKNTTYRRSLPVCSLFSRSGSCVSVPHAYFSCTRMYVYTPTNLRMRNATYIVAREKTDLYTPTAPRVSTLVPFIHKVLH